MKKVTLTIFMAVFILMLAACSSANNGEENSGNTNANTNNNSGATEISEETSTGSDETADETASEPTTVEITDNYGTVTVPVNPKNVVVLDNRSFETLADWGIELAAAPKQVMPTTISYVTDDSVQDIGNHGEPNLEIIAAVDPELVIVGQRFSGYYEDIKELVPNAAVIDINLDVSSEDGSAGENLVNGFKDITTKLGQIFDKNEEAEALNAQLDQAIEDVKAAYNGTDTVMSVIVSGGNIGYSAPHNGRVWGPLYDIFGWVSPA